MKNHKQAHPRERKQKKRISTTCESYFMLVRRLSISESSKAQDLKGSSYEIIIKITQLFAFIYVEGLIKAVALAAATRGVPLSPSPL